MFKKPRITEAEWPIMEFLWDRESATASQIVDHIAQSRDVSMRTVKALVRRLIDKKMVSFTVDARDSRVYHYRAVVSREQGVDDKNQSILNLVYGGKAGELLTHFVGNAELQEEEIDGLLSLLAKKKADLHKR